MGIIYDFTRLLEKYSVSCELIREGGGGSYVGGNWLPEPAAPPEMVKGAVIPMKDQKVYQSGGTYTQGDREFITLARIKYHVESENDYSIYAGFHDYNLKRVGAFERPEKS